jgi:hypothetical protein
MVGKYDEISRIFAIIYLLTIFACNAARSIEMTVFQPDLANSSGQHFSQKILTAFSFSSIIEIIKKAKDLSHSKHCTLQQIHEVKNCIYQYG